MNETDDVTQLIDTGIDLKDDFQEAHIQQLRNLSYEIPIQDRIGKGGQTSDKELILGWVQEQSNAGRIEKAKRYSTVSIRHYTSHKTLTKPNRKFRRVRTFDMMI